MELRCTVRACAFCQEASCTARPHNIMPNRLDCPNRLVLPDGAGARLRGVYRRQEKGGQEDPAPPGERSETLHCLAMA